MTRQQIWITVAAVAGALVLGLGVTLLITSGGDNTDQISTAASRPTEPSTTLSTVKPATTPPSTVGAATTPPTVAPTTPAPTVIVIPPATVAPTLAPTAPPTVAPTSPPTGPVTTTPTSPGTTVKPTVPPTTVPPTTDPGITATEIHVAVIADSNDSIAGMNAWAATVNAKKNGLGGRKIVIDAFPVGGDAAKYSAAVQTACTQDFAIVGTLSVADGAVGDLQACNVPDLPARVISSAHRQAKNTYAAVPTSPTKEMVGGFKWLLANVPGCCKQYVISSTNADAAAATQRSVDAATTVGFSSAGGAALANDAPQSSYTPLVHDIATKGATFGRSDLGYDSTIKLRTEAQAQDATGVKAWFCLAQCYQPQFLSQGGAAVEGELVQIPNNPFEDAASIPSMKKYLANGGPQSLTGIESYSAGVLFETAAKQVIAAHGKNGLTRAALVTDVAAINDFTAGGILGTTQVGNRAPNGCFVLLKAQGPKFVRAEPTASHTLSCGDQNLLSVGP